MNIISLFPKAPSKAALKRSGVWQELMADIAGCTSVYQVQKCRWVWALKAVKDMWPQDWIEAAEEKFDDAVEALAAQQAE